MCVIGLWRKKLNRYLLSTMAITAVHGFILSYVRTAIESTKNVLSA